MKVMGNLSGKWSFKDGGLKSGDGRDLRETCVEGDQFRMMMDGEHGDEEIE